MGGSKNKYRFYLLHSSISFFQIIYSFVKNHSTHLKRKLITAMDYNTKNYIFRRLLNLRIQSGMDKGTILNLYTIHSSNMRGIIELLELLINILGVIVGVVIITILLGVGGFVGSLFFLGLVVLLSKSIFFLNKFDRKFFEKNEKRIKLVAEILEKYKEIRLNNFEEYCAKKIKKVRNEQLEEVQKKNNRSLLFRVVKSRVVSVLIAFSVFISIFVYHDEIHPANILSAFLAFHFLEKTVQQFFMSLESTRICMSSLNYLLNFISESTLYEKGEKEIDPSIVLKDVCFRADEKVILNHINLEIEEQKIITISGDYTSGKSTLLNILSKRIITQNGIANILGKISYIKKDGWFLEEFIKNNIVLGQKFNEDRYLSALKLSCLSGELNKFTGGDSYIVTDGGKNLSGGQAIRIQLARAIYQESDILLLDDVLNSIDFKNRNFIIQNLVKDFWHNKILVMVTNDKLLIDMANEHYCMESGNLMKNKYLILNNPSNMLNTEYHKVNRKVTNKIETKTENNEKNNWKILKQYFSCIASKKMILSFVLLFLGVQVTDFSLNFLFLNMKNSN